MELNVDQLRIINSKPNGQCLIKGVAGSGKTTVAVSKIPILVNQYMTGEDKILFVTYNNTLIKYTQYLMKDIDIQQNIFFQFDIEKQLKVKTIDSIITSYAYRLKEKRNIVYGTKLRNIMLQAMGIVRKKYPEMELITDKNYAFLNEEIDWMKSCRYIERETYLNIDRAGRMSVGKNRFRLLKNSNERNAIFDVFITYEQLLENEKLTDYKTNALRVLQAFREGSILPEKYNHIIVDESQDLTRVQLEIIKYLYNDDKNTSIIFIADAAQSIYTQSWLSAQSFKSIGFDMAGKSNILSKNYRTTYEIAQTAYSLIEKDESIMQNDIFVKPTAIERHGDAPYYNNFSNVQKEAMGIATRIKQLSGRFPLKNIVIAAANNVYLEHIKDILIEKGIQAEIFNKSEIDFDEQTVRLYTLHSIKGLEFPVLFIAGINEGVLPFSEDSIAIGRRLLYVGMTRAKQELYLSSAGKESMFMQEINKATLRNGSTEFSPIYKVSIDKYRYVNRIKDINSREEIVRQWFIEELITKLNYPEMNIEIEYPVQLFSKKGFVDIVVSAVRNGVKNPFIMVETKQPGEDMDRAMKELKSYASCCPSAEYLVITDGYNTRIERNHQGKFEIVTVLPEYVDKERNMYEEYTFVRVKGKKEYFYRINREDAEEIIVEEKNTKEAMDCKHFHKMNIIGTVAAGVLKYANKEVSGTYFLPDDFGVNGRDDFMLKVSGDSMIDFQVDDGDYVVVKRQSYAQPGDIVIAGKIGQNEVTLKKYYNMQGNIMLTPGNPKYEPIMIPENEIFINGIVCGILKPR